ncbi:MAG: pentapeptide repeat-containing protein [Cytophagales bacterium]|nr:pentapeptide repeat-containing protein [Cytophagales bacterium]
MQDLNQPALGNENMNKKELKEILRLHKLWVETEGKGGKRANLVEAYLAEANLAGVNFERANLIGVNLVLAKLVLANLHEANLEEAYLKGVDLQRAYLVGADLREADLHRADLHRANLEEANLHGANLHEADLSYIRINQKTVNQIPEEIQEVYRGKWIILSDDSSLIIRSIEFPPEYHQAGISILNYFGTVLRTKYPEVKAKTRIEQEGLKLIMTIDPVKGDKEIIEKALDDYGLVVTGKITPEEFTDDKFAALELKNELRIAHHRIESQREFLQITKENYSQRIKSLEEEVDWLRNTVGSAVQRNHNINVNVTAGDKTDVNAGGNVSYAKDEGNAKITGVVRAEK